jgi:hypothetical protein
MLGSPLFAVLYEVAQLNPKARDEGPGTTAQP